jgi:ACS family hexuronate transporter-like MFS transporter
MAAAVSLWTVASVSHAFVSGLRGLLFARTALGLGEAATYPGAVRTAIQTLPPQTHMRACGVVYSGGALGAILTPIIMTPVALAWGWRGAFWVTGAAGALWLALWSMVSRRRDLARPTVTAEPATRPRWNDPRLWAFVCFSLAGIPLAFVFYEAPIYLSEVLHKSQLEIGMILWIPPLGWDIGNLFWGWVTDRFARGGASMPALRRQLFLLMLMSLPLAAVPHIRSYPITVAMLSLATFVAGGNTISVIAYGTRVYSTARSGFIAGVVSGAWSAFVALVMPVAGRLFDLHWYNVAFALAALCPVIGYLVWWKLH